MTTYSHQVRRNPGEIAAPATKRARTRRTPQAARELILSVASRRLAEYGLAGINIADVAAESGISHATLLHHFGSAAGMQHALMQDMEDTLLRDIITALSQPDPDTAAVCDRLFKTLATEGNARLLAWTAATAQEREVNTTHADLFATVVRSLAIRTGAPEDLRTARGIVLLIATSAIGYAIASGLPAAIGLDDAEAAAFPRWLTALVEGSRVVAVTPPVKPTLPTIPTIPIGSTGSTGPTGPTGPSRRGKRG